MIPADVFNERRKKLTSSLQGKLVLLSNGDQRPRTSSSTPYPYRGNSNFVYFCGNQPPGSYVILEGSKSYLFLEPVVKDHSLWHGAFPDIDKLAEDYGFTKVLPKDRIVKHLVLYGTEDVLSIPSTCTLYNKKLEALIGEAPDVQSRDRALAERIVELRMVQDESCQAELRASCQALTKAFVNAREMVAVGKTCFEVLAELRAAVTRVGMQEAFPPIVSPHAEILHNQDYSQTLRPGHLLLVDFGAESRYGMASDVSRTWPVGEKFDDKQQAIYDLVLSAQKKALAVMQVGTRFREVHLAAARELCEGLKSLGLLHGEVDALLQRGAYGLFMPHGIGHLIGLDVHDMEDLGDLAGYPSGRERSSVPGLKYLRLDRDLVANMAVTIEPGLYFIPAILDDPKIREQFKDCVNFEKVEDFLEVRGVRIEDTVLMKENGPENLTTSIPK